MMAIFFRKIIRFSKGERIQEGNSRISPLLDDTQVIIGDFRKIIVEEEYQKSKSKSAKYVGVKAWLYESIRFMMRYGPIIECILFSLFIFVLACSPYDFTQGLFWYMITNIFCWFLVGISIKLDLSQPRRFIFTQWPGRLAEWFIWLSMVGNCITTATMEVASYVSGATGPYIFMVEGFICFVNITLYGLALFRESGYMSYLFEDEVAAEGTSFTPNYFDRCGDVFSLYLCWLHSEWTKIYLRFLAPSPLQSDGQDVYNESRSGDFGQVHAMRQVGAVFEEGRSRDSTETTDNPMVASLSLSGQRPRPSLVASVDATAETSLVADPPSHPLADWVSAGREEDGNVTAKSKLVVASSQDDDS